MSQIDRQAAIEATWFEPSYTDPLNVLTEVRDKLKALPSAQSAKRTEERTETHACDCISRQAAISAICNACGKIDCDKMDKCKKLQLPPANCSEFPNNSDTISRQAAIDALHMHLMYRMGTDSNKKRLDEWINNLPSAQPEQQNIIDIAKVTMAMAEKADLVAVTRCKDCKHYHPYYCEMWSKYGTIQTQPDDYCSRAERRTDGKTT